MAACSVSPSVPDAPEFGHHEFEHHASSDMPGARPARLLVKPELTANAKHPSLGVPVKSRLHAGDAYGRSAHTRHNTLCISARAEQTMYAQCNAAWAVQDLCFSQPITGLYTCQPQRPYIAGSMHMSLADHIIHLLVKQPEGNSDTGQATRTLLLLCQLACTHAAHQQLGC